MSGSSSSEIVNSSMAEYAPLIILLPMLAMPVILFLGKIFNTNPTWKNTLKEGGIIALAWRLDKSRSLVRFSN